MRILFSRLRIFLIAVVIFIGVPGVVYYLDFKNQFQVQSFETTLLQPAAQEKYMEPLILELKKELQKKVGQSLLRIDLPGLASEIQKKNWIKTVHVRRVWPRLVHLQIEAKAVKLLYHTPKQETQALLEDGTLLKTLSENYPDVAYLKGVDFEKQPALRIKALEFLAEIPQSGKFQIKNIMELRYSEKEGFQVILRDSFLKVKMGTQEINKKAKRVARVLDYLEVHKIQAESLDLNAERKAFVKLKPAVDPSQEIQTTPLEVQSEE
jgi:cell division septal protein FtsQ